MVWKKDLEKLKQSLGAEDLLPRKPVPKPLPKAAEALPIEEEDLMFLSSMGQRPKPPARATVKAAAAPRPLPPPEPTRSEFASAMGELKGIVAIQALEAALPAQAQPRAARTPKPVASLPPKAEPAPVAPLKVEAAPAPVAAPKVEAAPAPAPPEPAPGQPVEIHLAAGMAIDVDASLDLKGHGRNDAEERLKERILDAQVLGWRSLHVVLGTSEDLRQMLLDLLKGSGSAPIARYAQAPIPMGGGQAWILYFRNAPAPL